MEQCQTKRDRCGAIPLVNIFKNYLYILLILLKNTISIFLICIHKYKLKTYINFKILNSYDIIIIKYYTVFVA